LTRTQAATGAALSKRQRKTALCVAIVPLGRGCAAQRTDERDLPT
jgi:hypothetical protein